MCKESEWGEDILVCKFLGTMFLNGFMHMLEVSQVVVVDMEGKTWRKILSPPGPAMSIHGDHGQLCLCIADIFNMSNLSIQILEDYGTSKWTLKHTVNKLQLFELNNIGLGSKATNTDYRVIAVHLEWNLIFLVVEDITLMAYDMSCRKVHVLPARVVRYTRSTGSIYLNGPHYLSYIPLFMESLAEQ